MPADYTTRDGRATYWGQAVTRLCAAIGKPLPAPLTPGQEADYERWMDDGDAAVAKRYGLDYSSAA